jgi:pyruvate,water dikinase
MPSPTQIDERTCDMTTTNDVITWQPPAPGSWELETVHVTGPQPLLFQRLAVEAFEGGSLDFAQRYGLPIESFRVAFVNDHCYMQMRGVGEPEPKAGKVASAPPDLLIKVLSRVHPAFRRRTRTARSVLAERTWVDEREQWFSTWRAEMMAANRSLQSEPISEFDDDALIDHLRRASDHLVRAITLHFRLIPVTDLPVGRLLVACRAWGIDDGATLALMAGNSPASTASAAMVMRIAAACRAAGVRPASLDDIRAASDEAAAALDTYLDDRGWRVVTQYSPAGLSLHELPNVVISAVVAALDHGDRSEAAPDVDGVRSRVPAGERTRFDELLADARAGYGARDDNVTLTFLWPSGLVRRALLEAGDRLVARGTIGHRDLVMTLDLDELRSALAATADDAAHWRDLARRRQDRMDAARASAAPLSLGPPVGAPPDFSLLPAPMAEVTAAVMSMLMLETAHDGQTAWTGRGTGLGTVTYTGRACVAADAEAALTTLQPGDVLIVPHTTPAYEVILPIAGAVVTDHGGLTSHAALVSRELGLPAVLGVVAATATIAHGSTVVVDPVAGTVRVATV